MSTITALLGPTNTGKTYVAMQRMLDCQSGVMGFPLRLLARENYDRAVTQKGASAVALITGEEKIIPKQARYFICTVEAMPLDLEVDFVGIDEVQLCGDPERGHIFTDRLLHCRGRLQTMFLGSETVRNLIVELVEDVQVETRPRFSQLTYVQPKKLSRIPRRSAVVVFSAAEVYRVAEELRQHRGGCAVVLGALSPRTRNAQVQMYQDGEVDYMVATDAIGMGLNMDLDHVTFARTRKFDGRQPRSLSLSEIAQIAGRAGRHMNNGTFTTTAEIGGFDEMTVEAVENHRFEPLKALSWRSRALDFSHTGALIRSLDQRPPHDALIKARDAEDLLALKGMLANEEVRKMARGSAAVRVLWDVAQVPDFHKTMTDHHLNMLVRVYGFLMGDPGRIPEDFIQDAVSRIDDVKGDIDTLINRIANIRTWTFISHRPDWITNAREWRDRTKRVDDRLSDALHDRLTQRFVDRRAAILVRSLVNGGTLTGKVEKDGSVVIEGQPVGTFKGFTFVPDPSILDAHAKPILTAARKALGEEVEGRVQQLVDDNDGSFRLVENGKLLWREVPMANLVRGASALDPDVEVISSDFLEPANRDRIKARLVAWLKAHLKNRLGPYYQLRGAQFTGTGSGLAFQLLEKLGLIMREEVSDLIKALGKDERKALYEQNVRIGRYGVWVRGLTNPQHWPWRALVWSVWHEKPQLRDQVPAAEQIVIERPKDGWGDMNAEFFAMLGFAPLELYNPRGKSHLVYVRMDALDRVGSALWTASDAGAFALPGGLEEQLACNEAMVARIVNALGFKRANERDIARANERAQARKDKKTDKGEDTGTEATTDAVTEAATQAAVSSDAPAAAEALAEAEEAEVAEVAAIDVAEVAPEAAASIEAESAEETQEAEQGGEPAQLWVRVFRRHGGSNANQGGERSDAARGQGGKPNARGKGKSKGPQNYASAGPAKSKPKELDENNPFAALAALKK